MIESKRVLGALIRVGLSGRSEGPMTPETFRRFVKQYAPGVYESLMRSVPHMEPGDLMPAAVRMFELDHEEANWLRSVLEHFKAASHMPPLEGVPS